MKNNQPRSKSFLPLSPIIKCLLFVLTAFVVIKPSFAQTVCTTSQAIKTAAPPTMTGVADATWAQAPVNIIGANANNTIVNNCCNPAFPAGTNDGFPLVGGTTREPGFAAQWQAQWTATDLYILVQVTDSKTNFDPIANDPFFYNYDAVEVYLSGDDNHGGAPYDADGVQYGFSNGVTRATGGGSGTGSSTVGVTDVIFPTAGGYNMAITIPLTSFSAPNAMNTPISFDIAVDDNDHTADIAVPRAADSTTLVNVDGYTPALASITVQGLVSDGAWRDAQVAWFSTSGQAPYNTPSDLSTLTLTSPPTVATVGPTQTICVGGTAILTGNTPTVFTNLGTNLGANPGTEWTYVSGPVSTLSSNSNPNATFTPTGGVGTYVYQWNIVNSPCSPTTSYSAQETIIVTALPAATISYTGSPFCSNDAAAEPVTRVGTAGGTYTATGGLTINAATGAITPSPSAAGVYTITYTMLSGCAPQTATTTITITALPAATITYAGPFCINNAVAQSVTRVGTAGGAYTAAPAGLTMNAGTGSITPSTSTAGTYTVTYTMAAGGGCAVQTATASVTITPLPAATITYAGPFCINNAVAQLPTQTGTGGGTYTAAPAGLTINAGTGSITPSTSTAGTYTVTYTMAAGGGCAAQTATASVTITPLPAATITYAGPFCINNAVAQLPTQTGTGGGTYTAAPVGLTINAGTGSITPSTSTAGTYTVTYTMAAGGGCAAQTATTSVTITPLPAATISYAGPFCINNAVAQTVTRIGTAGGAYTAAPAGLSINGGTGAITPSTSTAGTYTVTYTMAAGGGCAAQTATASVTITPLPAATISYAGPFCINNAVAQLPTQTGTGGGTYTVAPAGLTINAGTGSITPSTSTAGTYTVTYTMAAGGGCAAQTATTSVTITPLPAATISYAGPFCINNAVAQTVTRIGTAGGAYTAAPAGLSINGGTGAITPSTSTAGTYTVTYTMAAGGGCAAQTATASVTITPLPAATISYAGPFCINNAVAQLPTQTGTGGGTYTAAPAGLTINAGTGAITPSTSTAGTYTITYTMAAGGGCAAQTATASVTITALPAATITYAGPFCINNAVAQLPTQTGTGGGTYTAAPAGLTINAGTGAITPSTSTAGTYTITYTMAAGGGCAAQTATASVTITALPAATITYAGPFCDNDPAAKAVTRIGTVGGTYTAAPGGLTINAATGAITPSTSTDGTYTVTYTMAAGGGCAAQTATTSVTITPLPSATISYAGPFCSTDPAAEPVTRTGTAGGTYTAVPGGLTINPATGAITPSTSTTGTYTVTYTMAAAGGCTAQTATTSVTIDLVQSPVITCGGSTISTVTFNWGAVAGATGYTITYIINPPGAIVSGGSIAATTYTVSGLAAADVVAITVTPTGGLGCFLPQSFDCDANNCPVLVAAISYTTPFCSNAAVQSVTQTGVAGGTYSSTAGLTIDPVTGAITPSTSTPGTYTVTYTMVAGGSCPNQTATTSVTITPLPVATISYAGPFCSNAAAQTVTQTGTIGGTYTSTAGLTINAATGTITPSTSTAGTYTVTYTMAAGGGCAAQTATTSVTITTLPAATISYAGPFCSNAAVQTVTQTGTIGGTYTSTAGLTINAATGTITPSTSTPGTYTVTYTMAAGGGCTAQTAITFVTITPLPTATISYAGPFCSNDPAVESVTQTGSGGGTYTSTAGLTINAANGAITPATSTAGTYIVTYTMAATGGCTAQTATTSVTINPVLTPAITCGGSTTTTVTFNWAAVAGATGYTINYIINPPGATVSPGSIPGTTYTVAGLVPADVVAITVTPTGVGCFLPGTQSCTANNCPPLIATISYTSPVCSNAAVQAVTQTGVAGGTYSSTAGLTIDPVTGAITPTTSTAGTYTVTYTMIAAPGCPNQTATTTITITQLPAATISYAGPFCSNDPAVESVTQTGTGGGTYTSTAGLTINAATGAITPATSTAGTYTVTYTMAATGGCTAQTATTSVTINPVLTPVITCGGSTTTTVTFNWGAVAGATGYTINYIINPPGATVSPGSIPGTTYTVAGLVPADVVAITVTPTGVGCFLPGTQSCTANNCPPLIATISYTSPVCSNAAVQAVTQTGVAGGTYSSTAGLTIDPVTGAITPTTSTAGTYTVTYTMIAAPGCPNQTATTTITITPLPTATISYAGPFCSNDPAVEPVTQTGTGGGTYTSTAGLTINAATGAITPATSTAGTYTVTYTMAPTGGCTAQTATTAITITALPAATISYAGSPFCSNDVAAEPVTRLGTAGGTYTATGGLTINAATGAITPSPSTAGIYTITYTMAAGGGCAVQTATTNITITALPVATISYAGPFCSNDPAIEPVTQTGTGGGSYTAAPAGLIINAATGAITPSGSTAGAYTVTYTMAAGGGCAAQTATAAVTITALPAATISYAGPFCSNDPAVEAVTQTGTAGGTYGSTAGLMINAGTGAITPATSTAGTYTVTYTMAAGGGCTAQTTTTTVTITPLPVATISYGGPYCSSAASATVTQTGTPGGVYSSTAGLIINAGTGTITPSGSTAGTYTVTYTMAAGGGCAVQTATTTVTITPLPVATISYAGPFCSSDATAEPVTQTGTVGGTYTSTAGLTINAATGAITPSTSTAGTYTVTYTMAAGGGCAAQTATTTVTITPLPVATISYGGPYCSSVASAAVTQTGTPGGVYSSTAGLIINTATGTIIPSSSTAGTYTVTYTMAAAGGCAVQTATTLVTITQLPVATINYAGPYCSNDAATEPVIQTGTAGGTYSSAAGLSINAATGAIAPSASTAGTYTVTYTMAAGGGCAVQTASTTVTINPTPVLIIQNPNAVCSPGTVDITNPSVAINNSTLPPNTTLNYYTDITETVPVGSPQAIPTSGTYYIKATVSPSGCNVSQPVSVTINPQPAPLTPTGLNYCQGEGNIPSLTVDADADPAYVPGNTLVWYTTVSGGSGTTAQQYPSTAIGTTLTYFVTQMNSNGCESAPRGELDVKITTLPVAVATANPTEVYAAETPPATINLYGSTTGSAVTVAWYQGEGFTLQIGSTDTIKDILPPATIDPPLDTTRYYFVATATENTQCADTVSVLVKVVQHIVIPNIFSPNGDGVNDFWDIKNIQEFSDAEVSIFNRYGQFIYTSGNGYRTPWDGKYHGQDLPVGTYFYIIKTTRDAKPIAGDVSIVR